MEWQLIVDWVGGMTINFKKKKKKKLMSWLFFAITKAEPGVDGLNNNSLRNFWKIQGN